jgi:hypothetical protein
LHGLPFRSSRSSPERASIIKTYWSPWANVSFGGPDPTLAWHVLRSSGTPKSVQPADYDGAGLELAISLGWLALHKGGAFLKLTQSGADPFT